MLAIPSCMQLLTWVRPARGRSARRARRTEETWRAAWGRRRSCPRHPVRTLGGARTRNRRSALAPLAPSRQPHTQPLPRRPHAHRAQLCGVAAAVDAPCTVMRRCPASPACPPWPRPPSTHTCSAASPTSGLGGGPPVPGAGVSAEVVLRLSSPGGAAGAGSEALPRCAPPPRTHVCTCLSTPPCHQRRRMHQRSALPGSHDSPHQCVALSSFSASRTGPPRLSRGRSAWRLKPCPCPTGSRLPYDTPNGACLSCLPATAASSRSTRWRAATAAWCSPQSPPSSWCPTRWEKGWCGVNQARAGDEAYVLSASANSKCLPTPPASLRSAPRQPNPAPLPLALEVTAFPPCPRGAQVSPVAGWVLSYEWGFLLLGLSYGAFLRACYRAGRRAGHHPALQLPKVRARAAGRCSRTARPRAARSPLGRCLHPEWLGCARDATDVQLQQQGALSPADPDLGASRAARLRPVV